MAIYDPISNALGIDQINFSEEDSPYRENNTIVIHDPKIMREEAIKRNSEIIECDRCGVFGNRPNMIRWHFENCSQNLKECQYCGKCIPRQGIKPYLYKQKKYCNRDCYTKSKIGKQPIKMTKEVRKKLSEKAIANRSERSKRMKEIRKNKFWSNNNGRKGSS
jgi:hypothetical protein